MHLEALKEFEGTVAFISVKGVKGLRDASLLSSLVRLHNALRIELRANRARVRALSTLTGALLVTPDGSETDSLALLQRITRRTALAGINLRIGISRGRLASVQDIDGTRNLVGTPINIAARLAYSAQNTGCLIHQRFVEFDARARKWLARTKALRVPGKKHDRPFTCWRSRRGVFATTPRAIVRPFVKKNVHRVTAVVIAYDLPRFSGGDLPELRSRFRSVVAKVREAVSAHGGAEWYFSPGGDGGVIVLTRIDTGRGYTIADAILRRLEVEDQFRDAHAGVQCRVGVHYGEVWLYRNAEGAVRPTGATIFIADEVAGDRIARERKGVIITERLKEAVEEENCSIEELGSLGSGPARGIRRYVRHHNGHRVRQETIWVLGSYSELDGNSVTLAQELVRALGSSLGARGVRLVSGTSDMLTDLVSAYREVTMAATPPGPLPVTLRGKLRQRDLNVLFRETIHGRPDLAVVIGGGVTRGRVAEECAAAKAAGIPVLPIRVSGGAAARVRATATGVKDHLRTLGSTDITLDTNDRVLAVLGVLDRYVSKRAGRSPR